MKKIPSSEITTHSTYESRRQFIKKTFLSAASAAALAACAKTNPSSPIQNAPIPDTRVDELGNALTSKNNVLNFVNYYEFSTDKRRPVELSKNFVTDPWKIEVSGLVRNPKTYDIGDIRKSFNSEERIYRMRCVEGWSMVIPWLGFPLNRLIKAADPLSEAKYVRFESIYDPTQMPGQSQTVYQWPYVEGLRLDEAMHDLTLLATGLYGELLAPQNGAPIRLVVPWKYGFKSIKAIVKIELTDVMPQSLWMAAFPAAYGFYANVNPKVDHPRWSQAQERRIGTNETVPTLIFNGYERDIASLYAGLNLNENF